MSQAPEKIIPWLCNTFCNEDCTHFTTAIRSACTIANSECDCRPFWELPVFWIISLSVWILLILIIYCLVRARICCYCKKRRKVTLDPDMLTRSKGHANLDKQLIQKSDGVVIDTLGYPDFQLTTKQTKKFPFVEAPTFSKGFPKKL